MAYGSTAGVMNGRKYNRAIRVHKLCYEALMRLIWKGCLAWIETDQQDAQEYLDTTMQCVDNLKEEVSEAT